MREKGTAVAVCAKCRRRATMVFPRDLCDLHWTAWFCSNWRMGAGRAALEIQWLKHGRPRDWRKQLAQLPAAMEAAEKEYQEQQRQRQEPVVGERLIGRRKG